MRGRSGGPRRAPAPVGRPALLAPLLAALLLACGGDGAETGSPAPPRLEAVFRVDSLERPESVAWDAPRGRWLVTNVGAGREGEGGGFVAAIPGRGDSARGWTRVGGPGGLGLARPRGVEVREDTAWIADLGRVVAVDLAADTVLFRLRLEGAELLDDVARARGGPLFVSDTRADVVWRVATDGSAHGRIGAVGSLRGPSGLLAEGVPGGRERHLVVAGRDGAVLAVNADSSVTLLAEAPSFRHLDGLQRAPDGGLLVGDYGAGRIHHLRRRSPEVWRTGQPWLTGLTTPADFLARDSLLAVPELEAGRLTVYRMR